MPRDPSRYDPVWRAAEPYLRARKNDIHIPLSFAWCDRRLDAVPGAAAMPRSAALLPRFETGPGRAMAATERDRTRRVLMTHLI